MNAIIGALMAFSVLVPQKMWFTPNQPVNVTVKYDKPLTLVLTDFTGVPEPAHGTTEIAGGVSVDLKNMFPDVAKPGTYVLYAVPKGGTTGDFVGTPLVIETRRDVRLEETGGVIVTRVEPLCYAVMTTDAKTSPDPAKAADAAPVTMVFYYDSAPNTVDNFLTLSDEGYYNGIIFHRVAPGFVIQGGDPTGTGRGGPGYEIDAEFNSRPHEAGVLSMARTPDPVNNAPGPDGRPNDARPRPQYANSASSQFFICLDYEKTKALDGKYTPFGKVVEGMPTVQTIAAGKLAGDPRAGKPEKPVTITTRIEVFPVTPGKNPYESMMKPAETTPKTPTTAPAGP